MQRKRRQKEQAHFCILVNESASRYNSQAVDALLDGIRKSGDQYTILRPSSAVDLLDAARAACGLRRGKRLLPAQFARRGKVTGFVACGGDGTFNLVARAALAVDIPVGALPMGRMNNIAAGICDEVTTANAIDKILKRGYRKIDCGSVAGQDFFGSIGLGLIPAMARLLSDRARPRFAIGWSRLAAQAAEEAQLEKIVMKVDAFRFEVSPLILNINLLPRSLGMQLTPVSLTDDSHAEVIYDIGVSAKQIGSFIRLVQKGKYYYGTDVRLLRGGVINIQPTRGLQMYLDGELIDLPTNAIEVRVTDKRLKVFC